MTKEATSSADDLGKEGDGKREPPELSIIIVNWNGLEFLPTCLKSIVEHPPSIDYEVIVVDNDSNDGSKEWLEAKTTAGIFPEHRFRYIQSGSNLGFGGANNLAFKSCTTGLLFLLNPDATLKSKSADLLIDAISQDESIGMVGPRILNQDGSVQVSVWPHPPTATKTIFEGLKFYRLLPRKLRGNWLLARHWTYDEKRFVPSLSGAAILVKSTLIDVIGGFASDIHMYGEDSDWCARAAKHGWKLLFEPNAEVVHLGGGSSKQRWTNEDWIMTQEVAYIQYLRRILPEWRLLSLSLARLTVLTVQLFGRTILGRETKTLQRILLPYLSSTLDGAFKANKDSEH